MTEDMMVRRHHRTSGCNFEQDLGVGDGQGSLACCSPLGLKELDTTKHAHCSIKEAPASDRDRIYVVLPVKNAQTTAQLHSSHTLVK